MDGGARFMFGVAKTARLYAGPEATLGFFVPFGGDESARFLLRPAGVVALGIGEHVQVELLGEVLAAFGGSGSIVLGGGQARAGGRF
jgi:hypothetical protein